MKIKEPDSKISVLRQSILVLLKKKSSYVLILSLFILISFFSGMVLAGYLGTLDNPSPSASKLYKSTIEKMGLTPDDARLLAKGLVNENVQIPVNYFSSLSSNAETISIDIKNNDFQKLAYNREVALEQGILITDDDDYVPATIRFNDYEVKAKIRLKGDWVDHLVGDKWSFRVKLKDDNTILGMKVFSIQNPNTRVFLNEWLYQEVLGRESIISPRYYFVSVVVNGKNNGIYALEEHFDKRLIENEYYREGPIISFNEDYLWIGRTQGIDDLVESYFSSDIDTFQTSSVIEDPDKYRQFIQAKDLLESFREGNLSTSEVFDVDKLATFMALSDLMGATHGNWWHNQRFYYNPITSRLEPIGFDSDSGERISNYGLFGMSNLGEFNEPYQSMIYTDPVFFEKYVSELERVSNESYLEEIFTDLDDELKSNLSIIHKDYPYYYFSTNVFFDNQEYIRNVLNPVKCLNAHYYSNTSNKFTLELGNTHAFPLEVYGVKYGDMVLYPSSEVILEGKKSNDVVKYENIEFFLPEGLVWSDDVLSELVLEYSILGQSVKRNESIYPWSHVSDNFIENDFIRRSPNADTFDFIYVDESGKRIILKNGIWELNDSLIIPEGFTFVINGDEPTVLDLKNNSSIISYSPLQFCGSEDYPVTITSSDLTGFGLAVMNAESKSVLDRVIFSNLSAPRYNAWQLSGAVTFYNSEVEINECIFSNNTYGDDMLDLVRSPYVISNSAFRDTLSDALDDDFGIGEIHHTSFISCGNDAMDFSGSDVYIHDCIVDGAGDKGISGGENSNLMVDYVKIRNSSVGVASKDLSTVYIDNTLVSSSDVGLTAFQKKSEFGPGAINAKFTLIEDTRIPYIVESGSSLILNSKIINGDSLNVYEGLYNEN